MDNYVEVEDEEYYDEGGFEDYIFLGFVGILFCAVFAFVVKVLSKYLNHINFKAGNVEIGIEGELLSV